GNKVIDSLNVTWYYNWGTKDESTPSREYVPMAWGKKAADPENVATYITKDNVTHFLSFNEPDNKDQSNIPVANTVEPYTNLLSMGYRMGSPATTEGQATKWLTDFINQADNEKQRVDFIAIHWYDWGGWFQNKQTEPDPEKVFKRFKAYIDKVYNIYHKPIWITEFNSNKNTTEATELAFMKLALPYLESDDRVERYAYFFPSNLLPVQNGKLTPIGKLYQEFKSTPSLKANITE
ncbi:glycoside hydrolase family protein, partial [Pelobium sp.]